MKCIDELNIDRLAVLLLEKKELDLPEYDHISKCMVCKDRLDDAITLLSEAVYNKPKINVSRRLVALPIHVPSTTIVNGPTLLAADNSDRIDITEKAICVLSTNDGSTIVRLLKNITSQEFVIHVLSENSSNYERVLISIDGFSEEWAADEHGIASLGRIHIESPESLKVHLTTPINTIRLDAIEWASTKSIVKEIDLGGRIPYKFNFSIIPVNNDYQLRIYLDQSDLLNVFSQTLKVLVVKEKHGSDISHLEDGLAVFENVNIDKGVSINIYY